MYKTTQFRVVSNQKGILSEIIRFKKRIIRICVKKEKGKDFVDLKPLF